MSSKLNELVKIAKHSVTRAEKAAFVDGQTVAASGDPAAMGGGMPPGMDPAMAGGGMPPGMDPSMMGGGMPPGMDPSMMGAAPPAPGLDPAMIQQMIQQAVQQAMSGMGGGAAAGGGMIKPKIDINVAIMQMNKLLARIADKLGVQMSAAEMVATPQDLTAMAQQQQTGGGAIPPIQPIAPFGGGGEAKQGEDRTIEHVGDAAHALRRVLELKYAQNKVR